ncbi:MAG: hypothetical protein NC311_11190 [Muribaculaceae bacterium]|nr:hypothetical protein [Muribaculaceae bacterium]
MKEPKTTIFLSWSGPQSKELAIILKDFLCKVFDFQINSIFLSTRDINGNLGGWFETIRIKASESVIFLPCITQENATAPWLHFETGIGSYISQEKMVHNLIIPILFNLKIKDLNPRWRMFTHHEITDSEEGFHMMLKKIVFQIDAFLYKNSHNLLEHQITYNPLNYRSSEDPRINKLCGDEIKNTSEKLEIISRKYSSHDYFISRPMKAVSIKQSKLLSKIIRELENNLSANINYAGKESDFGENISAYRIGTIRRCNVFILIYPKTDYNPVPASSCLIELGAAIAEHKRIILIVEKNALKPGFFEDLKESIAEYYEYTNNKSLKQILTEIINEDKDCYE